MRIAIGAALALVVAVAANAAEFSSLEERMSQSEFHAAGLDRLTPEELKSLNDWLRVHGGTATKYMTPEGTPIFYPKDSERQAVESHIDGSISGWAGRTVFRLENGQEWTQAESGSVDCGRLDHPKVRVKPMLLGSWLMYIDGCSMGVRVTRTK
ncbi:MAG TPA: hypothetical protein VF132_13270 [Rudaea sp.]